ncbi:hypothetical protein AW736_21810 [Termitidicoccus mucosus]|uniref:Uncharacterized protein n=1 Tax=Termitidicoccus mucosus TaxID=1184151 RepID=A0A178ICB2_9BACT|nr:hypothetical protein AW736_21810 [Opitutaceae bacterium TSB47]
MAEKSQIPKSQIPKKFQITKFQRARLRLVRGRERRRSGAAMFFEIWAFFLEFFWDLGFPALGLS